MFTKRGSQTRSEHTKQTQQLELGVLEPSHNLITSLRTSQEVHPLGINLTLNIDEFRLELMIICLMIIDRLER